jgi:hypothetical protein
MESLAASLSHSTTRESAWEVVESFFEQHFRATGGVVSEHSAESMSFSDGWGIFSEGIEAGFAPPDTTEVDFWRPLLRSTSRWEAISPSVLLPPALRAGAGEEFLEVLRIPLEPAREASDQSTSLFVFRARLENAPPPPAQTALLGRVEMRLRSTREQVLAIDGVHIPLAEGEDIHVENSHKYRLDVLNALAARAGFKSDAVFTDPAQLFSVHLWTVAD